MSIEPAKLPRQSSSLVPRFTGHPFTLLEIILCLTILLSVAGAAGWNIKKLYDHKQVESTATRLVLKIHELQSLAVSYQMEMELDIFKDEQGLAYKVSTDEPLKGFNKAPVLFKDHCSITLNDRPLSVLKLKIAPTGWIDQRGVLQITRTSGQSARLWIDLNNAPAIKLCKEKPQKQKPLYLPNYPEEVDK